MGTNKSQLLWHTKSVRDSAGSLTQALVRYFGGSKVAHIYSLSRSTYEVELFPAGNIFFTETLSAAKQLAEAYFTGANAASVWYMGDYHTVEK